MTQLYQAHAQWANRPSDERFLNLHEMYAFKQAVRARSHARVLSSRDLQVQPIEGSSTGIAVTGPNGHPVLPTHWSFGQLAQRAGAPAGYLRTLPAPLAADALNYGLHIARDSESIGVLLCKGEQGAAAQLTSVNGPNYGRVWDEVVIRALINRFGDGATGRFRVPGVFGQEVEVTRENTTLYASDRDMWVFLADEKNRIEVPNRRDGKSGTLARGFFVSNSEVGKSRLLVATFLFDEVCQNRIIWGAQGFEQIAIRHTSAAPDRWIEEVKPAIEAYADSSSSGLQTLLANAKQKHIDDVDEFLASRFSRSQVGAIKAAHLADEDRPIETLWDATTAVTAYARGVSYQDERVELEREGGKILRLAA